MWRIKGKQVTHSFLAVFGANAGGLFFELLLVLTTTLNTYFACVWVYEHLCTMACVRQRTICESRCSPFLMWDQGMETSSIHLAATSLSCWAIPLGLFKSSLHETTSKPVALVICYQGWSDIYTELYKPALLIEKRYFINESSRKERYPKAAYLLRWP